MAREAPCSGLCGAGAGFCVTINGAQGRTRRPAPSLAYSAPSVSHPHKAEARAELQLNLDGDAR